MNIAVAGTGYVGLSIATLLSQHNKVTAVDIIPEKVEKINRRISPIQDEYIEKYFAEKQLDLTATLDGREAYRNADFVVIAAPTNYDPVKNYFDTHCIEDVIDLVLEVNPDAVMVIKSTIPVGYCRSLYVKYAGKGVKKFNRIQDEMQVAPYLTVSRMLPAIEFFVKLKLYWLVTHLVYKTGFRGADTVINPQGKNLREVLQIDPRSEERRVGKECGS